MKPAILLLAGALGFFCGGFTRFLAYPESRGHDHGQPLPTRVIDLPSYSQQWEELQGAPPTEIEKVLIIQSVIVEELRLIRERLNPSLVDADQDEREAELAALLDERRKLSTGEGR